MAAFTSVGIFGAWSTYKRGIKNCVPPLTSLPASPFLPLFLVLSLHAVLWALLCLSWCPGEPGDFHVLQITEAFLFYFVTLQTTLSKVSLQATHIFCLLFSVNTLLVGVHSDIMQRISKKKKNSSCCIESLTLQSLQHLWSCNLGIWYASTINLKIHMELNI